MIEGLTELKFGTKNLPDAMRWHCAFFWGHLFSDSRSEDVLDAYERLSKSVAIPIWLNRSVEDYKNLALHLKDIVA